MNEHLKSLMNKPSIESDYCVFCGRPMTERHHVVRRSQGGTEGPTVPVCGFGNAAGCHGLIHHHRLHIDWRNGRWEYLKTKTSVKDDDALAMDGWHPIRTWDKYNEWSI